MDLKPLEVTKNLWDPGQVAAMDPLEALVYRSRLLGSDRSVANYGGGNTSIKVRQLDHAGRETEVLWVKGSGSDLATITPQGFTGLRLDEVLPLMERAEMSDEDMVAYLGRCQLEPSMPRSSIETLLHAFVPHPHVDHTHPDAINMICCAENGEELARECFGQEAVWIPYIRPGFTLSNQVGEAVRSGPHVKLVLLAKHGLVTWGATGEESYTNTIDAVNRAGEFVAERAAGRSPFGGEKTAPLPAERRNELLRQVLPGLRGEVGSSVEGSGLRHQDQTTEGSKILHVDTSAPVIEFVCGRDAGDISQVGAACPDHLVHTKMRPLWMDFDPGREGPEELSAKLATGVRNYRREYEAYFARNESRGETMGDSNPRVVLISGVGMVTIGKDLKSALLSRDLYHRAIAVMRGASSVDRFVSLTEEESYAVEYWPLELYKLTLAPKPGELAGRVALVTGGAGGIGRAVVATLAEAGACVVVADLDAAGGQAVASELDGSGLAVRMDVTDERAVTMAYGDAVLTYGGLDIVVSNAGLASSASIEETSVDLWDRNHAVLAKGYFLVAREAFRVMRRQGAGGSIVFVASKNALVAGKNAAAYSSAKAAELHLARCLAEEGGQHGIRVNTVNPDAVLQGSKIWGSSWREERAQAYGIEPEDLEEHYRQRTVLKVNVLPQDIAEAVLFFTSAARSAKSTGNVLNVDGGVTAAYPR